MTLLDRFRTQPQRDPDPAVRLAYVAELPLTEREQIAAVAREDSDARVRKAAVGKLLDPPVLADIARDESDDSVREAAVTMLRDIALDAFEGVDEQGSLAAVDALTDMRILAQVAKTSLRESVARRAFDRLDQGASNAMAAIARQAELEPIRTAAFGRLSAREDFLNLAMHSDFKETAAAAVDRLSDRGDLEQVAERARNKAASKRARQILREQDEAKARAAREQDEAARAEEEERAAQAREAAAQAEAALRLAAETVAAGDAAVRERENAERAAREEAERREREAAAPVKSEAEKAAEEAALAREAERRRANEEAEAKSRRDGLNRMNQLLGRVEALIPKEDLSLKASDRALRDVRAALADIPPLPSRQDFENVSTRLKAAQETLGPRVRDLREVADWQRWANVGIQEQLCEKMEALRAETDPEAIARRIHELQQQWRLAADVPRPQGETLWKRFKAVHDELWARCEAHFAGQAEVALRACRGSRRFEQLGADSRRDQRPAGAVEGDRPGLARTGKSNLGAFPRGLRHILHPSPGRPGEAQGAVGRELREKRSALRESRDARRFDGVGADGLGNPQTADRVEDDRRGEEEPIGCDLAALPRRVRQIFRAVRDAARHRQGRARRRTRGHLRGARRSGRRAASAG